MRFSKWSLHTGIALVLLVMINLLAEEKSGEKAVRTIYNADGRVNHVLSLESKGWHPVRGQATLSGGEVTVTLNSGTADGAFDVTYMSDSTYHGVARAVDGTTHAGKTYTVTPISGSQFKITSSDAGDTATVTYLLQGE